MKEISKKEQNLHDLFRMAFSARAENYAERRRHEEFYFNDVESTKSEFTAEQKQFIDNMYNMPISTKISYAIIEQLLSFITGTKPMPRLIAPDPSTQEFTFAYQKAFHGTWYESRGDQEITFAIRDMFVTGSGFTRERQNSFYNESTFNVIEEYVDWKEVFVDPYCRKIDLSDAQFIVIAKLMTKKKAEREYDIKIRKEDMIDTLSDMISDEAIELYGSAYEYGKDDEQKNVWIREFFQKDETNVYIGDNGELTLTRPKSITIPNPEKEKLAQIIEQMSSQLVQAQTNEMSFRDNNEMAQSDIQSMSDEQAYMDTGLEIANTQMQTGQNNKQIIQLQEQINEANLQYSQMLDEIPAYEMQLDEDRKVITIKVVKIKKKLIKRTFMVANRIIEEDYIKTDRYPIHHFCFQWGGSPFKTYGTTHYIRDLVQAMNKSMSLVIYDMMTNSHHKMIYFRGTIEKGVDIEKHWSLPNAAIEIIPNPSLPDGGKPIIVQPSPLNQALIQMFQQFLQLIEYITGIYGVVQGNPQSAPTTFGATQSLQTFGTQRVKLYSRWIEKPLEDIAYSIVRYLQIYAPRDKILKYFDENGDAAEVQIMEDTEDIQFKVRVEITNSLPTFKQMAAQLIGVVAGQTKNPEIADFLTQYMLKMLDLPEANKMSEDMDILKKLQQQLMALQEQLKESTNKNKMLENNLYQKQLQSKVDLDAAKASKDIAVEKQKQLSEMAPTETVEMPSLDDEL